MLKKPLKGFALAEIVVALFGVSLVMFVLASLTRQVTSLSKSGKQTGSIIEFTNRTTSLLNNMPGWLTAMRVNVKDSGGNSIYIPCIPNTNTVAVFSCPAAVPALLAELGTHATGFNAVSPSEIVDTGGRRMAGTPSSPLYLNSDGVECTQPDANTKCEFLSSGYFLRENAASNVNPGNVRFLIKLEKNADAKIQNQNTTPMRPRFMSVDVGRAWLKPNAPADCPAGSNIVKVGYLNDGTPQCIKSTASCPTGKIQLGLDNNAQPICSAPPATCLSGQKVILSPSNSQLMCSSDSPCSANGQIFTGFYAGTGEPMCVFNSSTTPCPAGQIQMGQLSGGAPFCVTTQNCPPTAPLLTFNGRSFTCISDVDTIAATTCPTGQSVVKINPNGSAVCQAPNRDLAGTSLDCPAGHYVSGLWPNGNVKCAVLNLRGTYLECPSGQSVYGVWPDGSVKCKADPDASLSANCATRTNTSTTVDKHTVCCNAGETLISLSTLNDNNNVLGVGFRANGDADNRCGMANMVQAGGVVVLKCCK